MSRWWLRTQALVAFCSLMVATVLAADGPPSDAVRTLRAKPRAAWMPQGSFGVMTHYLIQPKGDSPAEKTAELNRIVDRFDLDHYIRQFQETRADWLIFTLGQCTGYSRHKADSLRASPSPERQITRGWTARNSARMYVTTAHRFGPQAVDCRWAGHFENL